MCTLRTKHLSRFVIQVERKTTTRTVFFPALSTFSTEIVHVTSTNKSTYFFKFFVCTTKRTSSSNHMIVIIFV